MKQTGILNSVDFQCFVLLGYFRKTQHFKLLRVSCRVKRKKTIFLIILVSLKGHKRHEPCLNESSLGV